MYKLTNTCIHGTYMKTLIYFCLLYIIVCLQFAYAGEKKKKNPVLHIIQHTIGFTFLNTSILLLMLIDNNITIASLYSPLDSDLPATPLILYPKVLPLLFSSPNVFLEILTLINYFKSHCFVSLRLGFVNILDI